MWGFMEPGCGGPASRELNSSIKAASHSTAVSGGPAKSVSSHSGDVALKNDITKVTQRNTSVTKLSTLRGDQIIGNIFFFPVLE